MARITKFAKSTESRGAAASEKTYSTEELARLYKIARADFLGLDFGVVTLNWNYNFIYDFLYHIRDIKHIDLAIEWLAVAWKDCHKYDYSYENVNNKELVEQCSQFVATLNDIRHVLIQRFENERNKQALIDKMLEGHCNVTTTSTEAEPVATCSEPVKTESPQFAEQTVLHGYDDGTPSQILIEDLPDDVKRCIVVPQSVFDIFVRQLNEDAWLIVEQNKSKYCDALRFLCNYYHILSRGTSREVFDKLLHAVVQKLKDAPSLVSSMGRNKFTTTKTINSSYKYYESPVKTHREKIWSLINDCEVLEPSLQPVVKAMERLARAVSQ